MAFRIALLVAGLAFVVLAAATFNSESGTQLPETVAPPECDVPSTQYVTHICHFPPGRGGTKAKLIEIRLEDFPCETSGDLDDDGCSCVSDADDDCDHDWQAYVEEVCNHIDDHAPYDRFASAFDNCFSSDEDDADD